MGAESATLGARPTHLGAKTLLWEQEVLQWEQKVWEQMLLCQGAIFLFGGAKKYSMTAKSI